MVGRALKCSAEPVRVRNPDASVADRCPIAGRSRRSGPGTIVAERAPMPANARSLLTILCLLHLAGAASTQSWSMDFHRAGLSDRCFGLGTYRGDLVAGGTAFQHDGREIDGIVRFDGNTWRPIGPLPQNGQGGPVRDVLEWNGDLYAGGEFTVLGGTLARAVARWDGSQWHALGGGMTTASGQTSAVHALAVFQNELYAGGLFQRAGNVNVPGLAKWNGSSWQPVGTGLTASTSFGPRVTSLLAAPDGRLYIGGSFATAGGVQSPNLVAWDGTAFHAVGGGIGGPVNTFVFALEEYQGDIVAGGNFGAIGSLIVDNVARFDGQQWHAMNGGVRDWAISTAVYSLEVYQGDLFVGGNFVDVGPDGASTTAYRVARWDGQWHGIGGIAGSDLATTALAMTVWDGELIVGGEFSYAGDSFQVGQPAVSTSVARWDGQEWSQLGRGLGTNELVRKIVPYAGGHVAVGRFTEAGGALATRVAFFDGDDWQAMGSFENGNVHDALVWNGELYVTGDFQTVNGQPIRTTARFDGAQWHALGQGAGGWCLEVHQGQLHAAGTGGARRWNGASWEVFMPATGGHVYDMQSLGGVLYLGGASMTGNNMLAWDGASLTSVGGGMDRSVYELGEYNGQLLAGGEFTTAGGVSAGGLALWTGSQWVALGPPLTAGSVESFAVLDGELWVGGTFTHYLGFPAEGLARLDPVSGWQPVAGDVKGAVLDICADPANGRLLLGGWFSRVVDNGTIRSNNVAILDLRSPWADIGAALPGRATPSLTARGAPTGPTWSSFELRFAPPGALGVLAVGFGRANIPLLGGTLVPPPQLPIYFNADAHGTWRTTLPLPAGVLPSGIELTAHAWLLDPAGPAGVTASNAVSGISP